VASTRRAFLKIAGACVGGAGAGMPLLALVARARAASGPASERPAKRWAMVIEPRKCLAAQDCRACADACHRIHNVPDVRDDARHEIKWIWKEPYEHAFPDEGQGALSVPRHDGPSFAPGWLRAQPVTVLCNHCERPPCVRVCPTGATFKRGSDGIVIMDDHRCIGCRYCMAACPYGSRSFNWRDPRPFIREITTAFPTRTRGVVEKCNFCEERIARGDLPACVKACPAGALTFGDLSDAGSQVRRLLQSNFTIRRKPSLGTRPQVYYLV